MNMLLKGMMCAAVMIAAPVMADNRDLAIQKEAEKNGVAGQVAAGLVYYLGRGVPQNFPEAMKWFKKAADQGNPDATALLGVMYEEGQGVSRDNAEALKWYSIAEKNGNKKVGVRIEALKSIQQSHERMVALDKEKTALEKEKAELEKKLGAEKLFETGVKYVQGDGVPQNMEVAAKYFRLAAEKGLPEAEKALKALFEAGAAVLTNEEEAIKYFRKTPDETKKDIFFRLGMSYDSGLIPDKGGEARRWLRKAADLGHQEVKKYLDLLEKKDALDKKKNDEVGLFDPF